MVTLKKFLFFISLLFFTNLYAEDSKIIEIIDANLFRLESGQLIKLAGIVCPSAFESDSLRRVLAENIKAFARKEVYKQKVRLEESQKCVAENDSVRIVHLFRKYPLNEVNISERYLEYGYGFYAPCDTMYMEEYRKASEEAFTEKRGIWKQSLAGAKTPDYFNRTRATWWIIDTEVERDVYFPIVGINYRFSKILNIYSTKNFNALLSGEIGTYFYFALPYVHLGPEIRIENSYFRLHYDALLPFFFIYYDDEIDGIDYWGYDIGYQFRFKNRLGIEIEANWKMADFRDENLFFISVSFATY